MKPIVRTIFFEIIFSKVIEQEFEEGLPQLIEMIREGGDKALGLRDNEAKA
jgi:hypothetical protein